MTIHRSPPSVRTVLLSLLIASAVPVAAFSQMDAVDVSAAFIQGGAVIENLTAVQISGIVVIHGKTNDKIKAEEAGRIGTRLGYSRIANLIVVRDDATDDAAIVFAGQRKLELEPALAGCRFRVDSNLGIIRLTGSVHQDIQSDLAVQILIKIDGVKEVHPDLARL